ncbi:MAG: hypothetical protein Q7S33_03535 [Nanoarchaeota archaeon]|nr:hypothetical protein [Nanoarchaeota archaeon]
MFKKKCKGCSKKIEKKFSFCPYCGTSFQKENNEEDFGMIGEDDSFPNFNRQSVNELNLPTNLDKVMGSLIEQLSKQLAEDNTNNSPRGFKIQISTGKPRIKNIEAQEIEEFEQLSEKQINQRNQLPKEEPKSNVRRLGDKIVYEIYTPNVKSKKDIVITKLEDSIEIKAYSKDKCFYKTIPLKIEIMKYYLKNDILFLELRG